MKKKLVIMLVAVMTAAAVFSGCGKKNAQSGTGASAEAEKDVQISAKELLKATDYDAKKMCKAERLYEYDGGTE